MKLLLIIMSSVVCCIFEGDSITDSGGKYYPMLSAGIANSAVPGYAGSFSQSSAFWPFKYGNVICLNRSVGGARLNKTTDPTGDGSGRDLNNLTSNGIKDRFQTWVQPLVRKTAVNPPLSKWESTRPTRKYIFSLMAGTNADTTNPTTHAANIASFIATVRAAGFDKVILCPLFSRTDGSFLGTAGSTTFDDNFVIPYNAIIVNPTWQSNNGVDAVPRWDQESRLCGSGAANNATYFQDTVHPTQAGAALSVPYFQTAFSAVLATL